MIISKVIGDTAYIIQTYPIKSKDNKGEWYETDSDWLDIDRKQGNRSDRIKIPLNDFIDLRLDIDKLIEDTLEAKEA